MDRNQIIEQLHTLLVENLELDVPDVLHESDRMYEYLHVDSIMSLQLIVYIEETFQVTVPEDQLDPDTFLTVGSLVNFIESLLQQSVSQ